MNSEAMKACPFCGGNDISVHDMPTGRVDVVCNSCSATIWDYEVTEAKRIWNNRAATNSVSNSEIAGDDAIKTIWRMAMIGATNIAIDEQNRSNDDDAGSDITSAQGEIIRRLKEWLEIDPATLRDVRAALSEPVQASHGTVTDSVRVSRKDAELFDSIVQHLRHHGNFKVGDPNDYEAICLRTSAALQSSETERGASPIIGDGDPREAVINTLRLDLQGAQDRLGHMESALRQAKAAIIRAAQDTLWCDDSPSETIVDRIDSALDCDETGELFASPPVVSPHSKGDAAWSLSEGQYDGVRDLIRQAYVQGCKDVHENYQEDSDPDFTEASYDYAETVTGAFIELFPSVQVASQSQREPKCWSWADPTKQEHVTFSDAHANALRFSGVKVVPLYEALDEAALPTQADGVTLRSVLDEIDALVAHREQELGAHEEPGDDEWLAHVSKTCGIKLARDMLRAATPTQAEVGLEWLKRARVCNVTDTANGHTTHSVELIFETGEESIAAFMALNDLKFGNAKDKEQ